MIAPLIRPTSNPMAIAAAKASGRGTPWVTSQPAAMPEAAMVEPTDRSKPPEMMTMVSPTATIPTMAMPRPILRRLVGVRKYGDTNDRTIAEDDQDREQAEGAVLAAADPLGEAGDPP